MSKGLGRSIAEGVLGKEVCEGKRDTVHNLLCGVDHLKCNFCGGYGYKHVDSIANRKVPCKICKGAGKIPLNSI
jgi:hypothetical protein